MKLSCARRASFGFISTRLLSDYDDHHGKEHILMKPPKSKWPDYFITIAIRLFFGALFGAIVAIAALFTGMFLIGGRRRHHAEPAVDIINHWSEHKPTLAIVIWIAIGALIGAITAVWTIPDWQTPWFKSEFDDEFERREAQKKTEPIERQTE
jgi:hypothetical protein